MLRIAIPLLFLFLIEAGAIPDNNNTDHYRITFNERSTTTPQQDTSYLNQLIINGKVWVGQYFGVYGTEFIFSKEWLTANITVNGVPFTGVAMKYDIYNDDILVNYLGKKIVILNKSSVQQFDLNYNGNDYRFRNLDNNPELTGFYEVIYDNEVTLLRKWQKKRAQFAIEAKYDEFQDDSRVVIKLDGNYSIVKNRRALLNLFGEDKKSIKIFMRSSKVKIDINSPASIIPLLEYYESINRSE